MTMRGCLRGHVTDRAGEHCPECKPFGRLALLQTAAEWREAAGYQVRLPDRASMLAAASRIEDAEAEAQEVAHDLVDQG